MYQHYQTETKVSNREIGTADGASLENVRYAVITFLDHYGSPTLLGKAFFDIIGEGGGDIRFSRLIHAAGYDAAPEKFLEELVSRLQKANCREAEPVQIKGIMLPKLLLMAVLEKMFPGNKFVTVKTVDQLESLIHTKIPEQERADLQKVIETYPVRLSMHTLRQMKIAPDVAYQYMPFVEELDSAGHTNTWIGQFHQGLLEQMYQNRVIFLLNMSCPVYCRFCFRKHKESRNQSNPTPADVKAAAAHVRNHPSIKEIVITGGDPFLNPANMACAIDELMEIPHVQTLRLATRSVAYYPNLFLEDDEKRLNYLKLKSMALQHRGKRMEVATHFIHPDEISPESLYIISELVSSGIAVYVQTPFLNNCNDEGPELVRLFSLLRGAGAELHYIYIPCSPIHGNSIYWTPISKGIQAGIYLRAHLSDRVVPRICTATPIGKLDWNSSGWAIEQDPESDHFIWVRSPYTPEYFKNFAPAANESEVIRPNEEGTIDVRYMAKIGDPKLFKGARKKRTARKEKTDPALLIPFQEAAMTDQRISGSIVPTGSPLIHRTHETRVEIDADADADCLNYIKSHDLITDAVIGSEKDAVQRLQSIAGIIRNLTEIPHVNAVRLRSLAFNYAPEQYTREVIRMLGDLNRLSLANPLRLEIETRFLHPDEVKPAHSKLARQLLNRGITVYNNTPLLGDVNDTPENIHQLAYKLRDAGIEFHHLYVAGLPVQAEWNEKHPVDTADVIDIATMVRREGSGREIPRYIIRTDLGEADFGLSSRLTSVNGNHSVTLLPYNLEYYRNLYPEFNWPDHVRADADGSPVIPVSGLISSDGFMAD